MAPSEKRHIVHGDAVDPAHLQRAGWSNAELIWEQIQEAAATCDINGDRGEAADLWRGALDVACRHLSENDPRHATSLASSAVVLRRNGEVDAAATLFHEALAIWEGADAWVASLRPERIARSSTFHLRLERKHPGGYERASRELHAELLAEGRAAVWACSRGEVLGPERLRWWCRERHRMGFTDTRKLMAAALLMAPGADV